jgi:hypothetical protein
MKYAVPLEGFEGQNIELQAAGLISGAKLLVNGETAPKGKKRGEMLLRHNDGREVIAKFQNAFLDIPKLKIDEQVIQVVEPLKWYEWAWNAIPLLIIFSGGAIPAVIGFLAFSINATLFRSQKTTLAKYGLTGLVSFAALIVFLIVAVGFGLLLGSN